MISLSWDLSKLQPKEKQPVFQVGDEIVVTATIDMLRKIYIFEDIVYEDVVVTPADLMDSYGRVTDVHEKDFWYVGGIMVKHWCQIRFLSFTEDPQDTFELTFPNEAPYATQYLRKVYPSFTWEQQPNLVEVP